MQHTIPVDQLTPQGRAMVRAIESCVHCGLCLAACPTYRVLGEEMDSPRGRIVLMKLALEGDLGLEQTLPFVDRCLGCLGCVTACPSGVAYGDLVSHFRAHAEERRSRPLVDRAQRWLVRETLPAASRFRTAARLGSLSRPISSLLPPGIRTMLDLLPDHLPAALSLPEIVAAEGTRRARVAFVAGCVQQAMAPQINWATLRVLARNGVEVVLPQGQGCCGALMLHTGEVDRARDQALHNLRVFPTDVDAIVTNAAGCGSAMREYPGLFEGYPFAAEAKTFARLAMDVSVFLEDLGVIEPPPLPRPVKIAYHDACHLAHAQKVTEAPRNLLRHIPHLTLMDLAESDLCCGSAGTYNLEQPEIAATLGQRKAENILRAGSHAVAAGNIGCIVQIRNHLERLGMQMPVFHTIEILDLAYEGGLALASLPPLAAPGVG